MADATDIHGTVFKNGSATLLARAVKADGTNIVQADISSIAMSVYLLDDTDPDSGTIVTGHSGTVVVVADTIYDALQTDALWDVDTTGYNFKHVLDTSAAEAFATAGRSYRIIFTLTPAAGQVILVRFRVYAI